MVRLTLLILAWSLLLHACAWQTVPRRQSSTPDRFALEQARKGLKAAKSNRPKLAVAAFSRALDSNGPTDDERAIIFNNRGVAHKSIGEFNKAIGDFSKAITLRRGTPTKALHNRGITYFFLGRFRESAQDLAGFIKQNPDITSPYPHLWLYLARKRAGQDGRTLLSRHANLLTNLSWPGPVVALHLGKRSPDELLASIGQGNVGKSGEDACDAYFHLGEYYLLKGDEKQARHWFHQAVATGQQRLNEHIAAGTEIQRLDQRNKQIATSTNLPPTQTAEPPKIASPTRKRAVWSEQEERSMGKMMIQAFSDQPSPVPQLQKRPPLAVSGAINVPWANRFKIGTSPEQSRSHQLDIAEGDQSYFKHGRCHACPPGHSRSWKKPDRR